MNGRCAPYFCSLVLAVFVTLPLRAGEPSVGPDAINGDNNSIVRWGSLNGYTAYSVGHTICNIGDENLQYVMVASGHPTKTMNLYRLSLDGRFEQLGMHWAMHSFCAAQFGFCGDCPGGGGCLSYLQAQCSDAYTPQRTGSQNLLGPRWQINAHTAQFPYPPDPGEGGPFDVLDRRLHVLNTDVDPALNHGAQYFSDVIYMAADDAAAGNQDNNSSYRPCEFGAAPTFFGSFVGPTVQMKPAIDAWRVADPDVIIEEVRVPDEGLFFVGYKVSDISDGLWHYEYAIQNLNSARSARALTMPIGEGVTVTNRDFHDVDYHSGDGVGGVNVDGTDWAVTEENGTITWQTQTFAENVNANALRWATLYNFRFDADAPPIETTATLGLFVPMDPMEVEFALLAPGSVGPLCFADVDESGEVGFADLLILLAAWGESEVVADFDGGGVGFSDLLALLAAWGPCA